MLFPFSAPVPLWFWLLLVLQHVICLLGARLHGLLASPPEGVREKSLTNEMALVFLVPS